MSHVRLAKSETRLESFPYITMKIAYRGKGTRDMRVRIKDFSTPNQKDIDLDATFDAPEVDAIVNRCVSQVTESLKSPTGHFTDDDRGHMTQIFFSLRNTHLAIRKLLEQEDKSPISVSAMPLVRIQLETLFAISLIVEQPDTFPLYLKDGWKRLYVRHLWFREESKGLPRITHGLSHVEPSLEGMRILAGVSDEEKLTIDVEELGVVPPPGFRPKPIRWFPTPGDVLDRINEPARKRMLARLLPEYDFLCSFVHVSPHSKVFPAIFDRRQPFGAMFTTGQRYEMFQKEIAGPALWLDLLSIVQSCCEFVPIYPADMDLVATLTDAWKTVHDLSLIGRKVWELRAKKLLGALD